MRIALPTAMIRPATAVIGLGLLATTATGVTTAATASSGSGHGHKSADTAHNSADTAHNSDAYLDQLTPIAKQVYSAIDPVQRVLDKLSTPHAGDIFAARDAVIHSGNLHAIKHSLNSIKALEQPAEATRDHKYLVSAVKSMTKTLTTFQGLSKERNVNKLINEISGQSFDDLGAAENTWDVSLERLYSTHHRTAPRDFNGDHSTSMTRASWIFAADRSCNAVAAPLLTGLVKLGKVTTPSAGERYDALWHAALTHLSHRLHGLRRPTGIDPLPASYRLRLKVLAFNAKVFSRQHSALQRGDYAGYERTREQIREVLPSLHRFGLTMSGYGAVECGRLISVWSGHIPGKHRKAVSA